MLRHEILERLRVMGHDVTATMITNAYRFGGLELPPKDGFGKFCWTEKDVADLHDYFTANRDNPRVRRIGKRA